jgi:hypothetical protein
MLSTFLGIVVALGGALGAALLGLRRSEERRQHESQRALGAAVAAETQRRMAAAAAAAPADRDDLVRRLRAGGEL